MRKSLVCHLLCLSGVRVWLHLKAYPSIQKFPALTACVWLGKILNREKISSILSKSAGKTTTVVDRIQQTHVSTYVCFSS